MIANRPVDVFKHVPIGNHDDCWPYKGPLFPAGYGRFLIGGTSIGAHVQVYKLVHGEIVPPLYVLHKCNNKSCCNPKHLILGTNSQNQRHASASGAWKLGSSGIRGVSFDGKRNYWRAQGYRSGKMTNLYTGPHKDKAIDARQRWEADNLITFKESHK